MHDKPEVVLDEEPRNYARLRILFQFVFGGHLGKRFGDGRPQTCVLAQNLLSAICAVSGTLNFELKSAVCIAPYAQDPCIR